MPSAEAAHRRGFAALHRDVWATVLRAPVALVVLPWVIWTVAEAVLLVALALLPVDGLDALLLSGLLFIPLSILASLPTVALIQGTIRAVEAHGHPTTADVLAEAGQLAGRAAHATWAYLWRFNAGLILLAVPGIIAAVQYAFVIPEATLTDRTVSDAVRHGPRRTRGHRWRLLGLWTLAMLLYAGPQLALQTAATALPDGPLYSAAVAAMMGLSDLTTVGTFLGVSLVWADLRPGPLQRAPVAHREDAPGPWLALAGGVTVGLIGWGALGLLLGLAG